MIIHNSKEQTYIILADGGLGGARIGLANGFVGRLVELADFDRLDCTFDALVKLLLFKVDGTDVQQKDWVGGIKRNCGVVVLRE